MFHCTNCVCSKLKKMSAGYIEMFGGPHVVHGLDVAQAWTQSYKTFRRLFRRLAQSSKRS